ncbi:restriction endonuclease subunit S [Paraclostridium benzoelyticum]|uniref:restriction endonuclease subunit S n=1 Tax=Paraclostridium benzoelyticum TaxID=1629550 RepID=UPI0031CD5297
MKYRYRTDDEMKDSGVAWIGKIPKDWEIKRNRHIFDFRRREVNECEDTTVLSLTTSGVKVKEDLSFGKSTESYIGHQLVYPGDIVFTPRDFDQTPILSGVSKYYGCISNLYFVLKCKSNISNYFVDYFWWGLKYKVDFFKNFSYGIRYGYNYDQFKDLLFLNPSYIEQEKIANFLDEKTSQFDLIISKKEELIKKLEEAKKSLISEVVIGKVKVVKTVDGYELVKRSSDEMKDSGVEWLGEIPKDWEVKKFSNVIKISNGQVNPKISPYSEMILIAPNHIKSGMGKIINLETAKEQGAESGKYICDKGDIIYSKIRPNLCKVCIAPIECLCSADMYPMKTDYKILNQEYLLWILLSDNFTRYVVLESDRVAMPKVNRESIAKFKIPTPSIEEQISLNKILKQNDRVIDNLINKTKLQIEKLKEAKQSLISEAVTGKIEILD